MKELKYDRISSYLRLNKKTVILFAITGTIFNVTVSFLPTLQGNIINEYAKNSPYITMLKLCIVFALFVFFVQINRFLKRLFRRKMRNNMMVQMRQKAFANMLSKPINEFHYQEYGDIMNRQLADIKDAAHAIETCVAETFDSGVLLVSYFIFMGLMSLKLAAICMGFSLIAILLSLIFGPFVRRYTKEYKRVYSNTKSENITVLQNEVYYRGFGINKNYYDSYKKSLDVLEKKAIKNTIFRTSFEPLYLGVAAMGYVFAIYFGVKNVYNGLWAIGTLTAFITSFTLARKKCGNIGRIINNVQNGFVAWDRCKKFLNDGIKHNNALCSDDGLIVSNLSFGFDDTFRLKNISFEAKKGQIIGVCGKIRSGKTTLVGALSGIYDYDGSIKLGGLELKDHKDDLIDSFIHIAPGKVEIFNDTLEYNITFGNKGDIKRAIDTACLTDDIDAFNNKENEVLSHSLLNISGGQQRRLQIARAVYSNPKMVVLDDPFNAIGIEMSINIINNLRKNYPDTIFIIINNQRQTLKLFDHVLFLNDSNFEFDTFDNLIGNPSFNNLMGGER